MNLRPYGETPAGFRACKKPLDLNRQSSIVNRQSTPDPKPQTPNPESGFALLIAIGYLAAVTLFATAYIEYLRQTMDVTSRAERQQVCLHLAEAGLEQALANLQSPGRDYRGETNTPLGDGRFSVAIAPTSETGAYEIHSTGELHDGDLVLARLHITAEARLGPDNRIRAYRWIEVQRR